MNVLFVSRRSHTRQVKLLEHRRRIEHKSAPAVDRHFFRRRRLLNQLRSFPRSFRCDLLQPAAAVEFPRRCVRPQKRVVLAEDLSIQMCVLTARPAGWREFLQKVKMFFYGSRGELPFHGSVRDREYFKLKIYQLPEISSVK